MRLFFYIFLSSEVSLSLRFKAKQECDADAIARIKTSVCSNNIECANKYGLHVILSKALNAITAQIR